MIRLRSLCREHLAAYEVPSRFEFVQALPRSPLGKLLKYRLTSEQGEVIEVDGEAVDEPALTREEREP